MCGSADVVRREGAADPALAERMAARLAARGPDGSGSWAGGRVALAHRRLKIIDLSEKRQRSRWSTRSSASPSSSTAASTTTASCAASSRADGYRFFSTSDTEVLLKGYHRWGLGLVEHLLGMFAFAMVEIESGRAMLARDRLGIKPLYIAEVGGSLRFASTPQALIAGGGVDTSIDRDALHHYLTWHAVVPAAAHDPHRRPQARAGQLHDDRARRPRARATCYWQPDFSRDPDARAR